MRRHAAGGGPRRPGTGAGPGAARAGGPARERGHAVRLLRGAITLDDGPARSWRPPDTSRRTAALGRDRASPRRTAESRHHPGTRSHRSISVPPVQRLKVRRGQRQQGRWGGAEDGVGLGDRRGPRGRGGDDLAAAVGRVRRAFHQAALREVVHDEREVRAVRAEVGGELAPITGAAATRRSALTRKKLIPSASAISLRRSFCSSTRARRLRHTRAAVDSFTGRPPAPGRRPH